MNLQYLFQLNTDTYILYSVVFFSILFNIYTLIYKKYIVSFLFILLCIFSFSYIENIVIVLLSSLLFCLLVINLQHNKSYTEGMKNDNDDNNEKDKDEDENEEILSTNKKPYRIASKKGNGNGKKIQENSNEIKNQANIEGMQANYKELMSMQSKIIDNMYVLEKSLTKADKIIHRMRDKIK